MAPNRIHVLLPAIHGRPTGGNVYNEALLNALSAQAQVVRHLEGTYDRAGLIAASRPGDVVLVDSLLLDDFSALAGEGGFTDRSSVLVAHYLHLLDPRRRSGPQADRERTALAEYDGFVTTSGFARRALLGEGLSPERVLALKPGIDPRYWPTGELQPSSPSRLLSAASLLPDKGLLALLSLLESLEDLDWRWAVAGDERLDPGYAAQARRRFAHSPVAARIELLGPLPTDHLAARYRASDLLLHASAFETCGMVVMEALASGLPVVALRVGGLPEQVRAAGSALLVDPGRPGDLGTGLRRLLGDPAELTRMRRAARGGRPYPTWPGRAAALLDWLDASFGFEP